MERTCPSSQRVCLSQEKNSGVLTTELFPPRVAQESGGGGGGSGVHRGRQWGEGSV